MVRDFFTVKRYVDCLRDPGTPFYFMVSDLTKASAHGAGLETIRCHQQTSFTVSAPAAQMKDLAVSIMGTVDLIDVYVLFLSSRK